MKVRATSRKVRLSKFRKCYCGGTPPIFALETRRNRAGVGPCACLEFLLSPKQELAMWCNHQAESTVARYISLPDAIYFYLAARDTNLHETP